MSRCVNGRRAWWSLKPNRRGDRYPVFDEDRGEPGTLHWRDCGECVGCADRYGHDFSIRAYMEAHQHARNCVVGLTLEQPVGSCMDMVPMVQRFFKRVRRSVGPMRYLATIERGGAKGRVHAHVILFGLDFAGTLYDERPGKSGKSIWSSSMLDKLWCERCVSLGLHSVQPATPAALFYVAGDAFKNFGEESHVLWSRKPFLGQAFVTLFGDDLRRNGFLTIDGSVHPIPKQVFARAEFCELFAQIKRERAEFVGSRTLAEREAEQERKPAYRVNTEARLRQRKGLA